MNKTDKRLIAVAIIAVLIMWIVLTVAVFAEEKVVVGVAPGYEMEYIGDYWCSAYCECTKCCGKNACGITASGLPVKSGYCAVDTSYIPLGTKIYVEGVGVLYACDTGVKGNVVDIYDENGHNHALHWNDALRGKHKVWILKEVTDEH